MGGTIKYSKITTNGYDPLDVTTAPYKLELKPSHKEITVYNELNSYDVFIRINEGDPIRIPAGEGYLLQHQYINTVTFETAGKYEYQARY